MIQFDFQTDGSFQAASLMCSASSGARSLAFSPDVQDVSGSGDPLRTYRIYFLFDQTLAPSDEGQPYLVEFAYDAEPYPNLPKTEFGTLTRWQGDADEMILATAFPRSVFKNQPRFRDIAELDEKELTKIGYISDGDRLMPSERLAPTDFIGYLDLALPIESYYFVGQKLTKVAQSQCFGFVVDE